MEKKERGDKEFCMYFATVMLANEYCAFDHVRIVQLYPKVSKGWNNTLPRHHQILHLVRLSFCSTTTVCNMSSTSPGVPLRNCKDTKTWTQSIPLLSEEGNVLNFYFQYLPVNSAVARAEMMSKGYLLLSFNLMALIKLMRWMWSQCPVPNLGTGYTRPQYSSLKVENAKKLQVRQDDRINIFHSGLMGIFLFIWSSYTTDWTPLDDCHWPLFFKTKHQGSKMHQSWRPGARMAEICAQS